MPRMYIGNLKFAVGSDDFFLPGLVGFFNRLVFIGLNILFIVFATGTGLAECSIEGYSTKEEEKFVNYAAAFLAIMVISMMAYAMMFYVATRGTPADGSRRKSMPKVLIFLQVVYLLQALMAVLLTILAISFPREGLCEDLLTQKFALLVFAVCMIWADLITYGITAYIFLHRYDPKLAPGLHLDEFDQSSIAWEKCFRIWCRVLRIFTCNLFGYVGSGEEADETYRSVAEVFNAWFSQTNLTLTDLATAAILVRADQIQQHKNEKRYTKESRSSKYHHGKKAVQKTKQYAGSVRTLDIPPSPSQSPPSPIQVPDSPGFDLEVNLGGEKQLPVDAERAYEIMKEHYKYLPYIIGMYGWKLMVYRHVVEMKPFTGLRKVLHMPNKNRDIGHGDNWCNCSKHALLEETQIDPKNVIYGSFGSVAKDERKSLQVPHAVFVDHEKKAVVVAMRGTLSLQDLMTDAMVEPESLITCGRLWGFDGSGKYAHKGMLRCAMQIRAIFEKNLVLHRLLGVEQKRYEAVDPEIETLGLEALNVDLADLPDCRGYELIIMGHSLGAAVAGLLTYMLRNTFPGTRCLAYAMPGAVASMNLAEESDDWCTNMWLGYDLVPQLNWQSLSNIRLRAFDVLSRCKVSKARVFRSILTGETADDLLYENYELPETEERLDMKDMVEKFKNKRASKKLEQITMHGMGIPIHLAKVETVTDRKFGIIPIKHRIFEPHLVKDRRVMEDPLINTRCLFDHFPNLLPGAMAQVIERHEGHLRKDEL